jgi:hypothetical protein
VDGGGVSADTGHRALKQPTTQPAAVKLIPGRLTQGTGVESVPMFCKSIAVLGAVFASACYSVNPPVARPLVVISHTVGSVVTVSDRTDVLVSGHVYTWHRKVFGRTIARRSRLSPAALRELDAVLKSADFAATARALASSMATCGTFEEDTTSVTYARPDGTDVGFCTNDDEATAEVLFLLDRLEAPLIRELGQRYTTRAAAHVRQVRAGERGIDGDGSD